MCAGQGGAALRRRWATAAGTRATGPTHYLQHEPAQVRGGGLQSAQRIRLRRVRAGKVYKDQQPSGSEAEDDDVEAALKKEVGGIKASTEMKLRRFQSVESGANNVVFIRTLGIEPEKLVRHILQDMYKTKKKKTRVILRMLPISGTCKLS